MAKETKPIEIKEEVKQDDSIWEIVSVPVQTAPAIHNKNTDEILNEHQAMAKILEGIEFIKRRVGWSESYLLEEELSLLILE